MRPPLQQSVTPPSTLFRCLILALTLAAFKASAQWPFPPPTTRDAQRNALNALRSQINNFQSSTRTAPNYGENGFGAVWNQFQGVRGAYTDLKQTLNPQQLARGANALAELDAGLDILQEAFGNFQNDVGAGRVPSAALRDMCQVLRQGSTVWAQEMHKTCSQLRVGLS